MPASPKNRKIAAHIAAAFGGTPAVFAFHHETEPQQVDIVQCADRPQARVTCYSTLGLSDCDRGGKVRVELAGACSTDRVLFPNALASAAFSVMRSGELIRPGVCLAGAIEEYYPLSTVPHLYFTAPFLWEDSLPAFDVEGVTVAWVLAIPISDRERDLLIAQGEDALEDLFEETQIDIYDLQRACTAM